MSVPELGASAPGHNKHSTDSLYLSLKEHAGLHVDITTYNINSLSYYTPHTGRKAQAVGRVVSLLKETDILCLQETCRETEKTALCHIGGCQVSFNNHTKDSSGTLIIDTPNILKIFFLTG